MQVAAGQPFTTSLVAPPGDLRGLGARVEVPVTRAIVSMWVAATLDAPSGTWTVTLDAPLQAGDYQLVWMTADDPPSYQTFIPLTAVEGEVAVGDDWQPVDPSAVRPSVDDVAALERTRAVTEGGGEEVTFDANTRPTADEVNALIDSALEAVLSQLWDAFPTIYYGQVKHAVALYTAILVEGSYFRDQNAQQLWNTLYNATLTGVQTSIGRALQHTNLSRGLEPTPLPPMPRSYETLYSG